MQIPKRNRHAREKGATYRLSAASRFDVGYAFIHVKDADIESDQTARARGIVRGTYEANVNILSLQYQHRF